MVLEPKQTTVAYRCPHCGAGVMSAVGIFALSGDMVKLKCTCGHSELQINYSKDGKIRIKSPCIICPSGHNYTLSKNIFFGRDLFVLPCPVSDINICMIGETERVKAELARTELELLKILEESGAQDFSALHEGADNENKQIFTDPQIMEIILFVIRDLEAEGKIYCKCHPAPEGEGKILQFSQKSGGSCADHNSDYECNADCSDSDHNSDYECNANRSDSDHESGDNVQNSGENEHCCCHDCHDKYGFEPEHIYDVDISEDGIKVTCSDCGYFRVIPTDSLLGAHAFLNSDALYLSKDGE